MYKSLILMLLIATLLSSCRNNEGNVLSDNDINFTKEATGYLIKSTTQDTIKVLDLEIADTDYDVQTGLMYRTIMEEQQAMLFVFEEEQELAFYMKNTQIPLDIIYLNKNGAIVSFVENAKPMDETLLPSDAPAQYTLEIKAGLAEKWGLDLDDVLVWEKN